MSTKHDGKHHAMTMAGVAVAAVLLAATVSFAIPPAMAQDGDPDIRRVHFTKVKAAGVAQVPDSDTYYKAAIFAATKLRMDNETGEEYIDPLLGRLWIRTDEGLQRYVGAGEWTITSLDDGDRYEISGMVKDAEGLEYEVEMEAYYLIHFHHGSIYVVEGTFSGNGIEYDLLFSGLSGPEDAIVIET